MEENKNLVKEFLLEQKIIDPDKFMYNYFYEGEEWFAYKLSDNTVLYLIYELTPQGLGYAFCATVKCTHLSYEFEPKFYTKSFSSNSTGEWKNIPDKLKDKLLSDAMRDLQIWKK